MKKIGIMQPYLFPYLGYFQLLDAVDEYIIYDDVQYIKGGWINRNNLLIGGEKNIFTISIVGASARKNINELYIRDDFKKFLKTIDLAYAKAPYKKDVTALIHEIVSHEDKNLARFIGNSIGKISSYLGIDVNLLYSSSLRKDSSLKGQDKILNICDLLGADAYINAIGGQELYDKELFARRNIDLYFLRPHLRPYKQVSSDFVPGLSIIDVMMFNNQFEITEMLSDYELI